MEDFRTFIARLQKERAQECEDRIIDWERQQRKMSMESSKVIYGEVRAPKESHNG